MKRFTKKQYAGFGIIAVTILFIWGNSFLSKTTSSEASSGLSEWLASVFGTKSAFMQFVTEHIRKIAHFTVYGVLGIEMVLTAGIAKNISVRNAVKAIYFALTIAFLDETIQIFAGRGPMIQDVWLDLSGFAALGMITILLVQSIKAIKRR